jgi:hypothetical protein
MAKASTTRTKSLTFRYRWVCDSGHTAKQKGPYKSSYDLARKGGDAHDKARHGGVTTSTVEISSTVP